MTFSIDKNIDFNDDFVEWLLEHIRYKLLSYIKPRKLQRLKQHIINDNPFELSLKELNALNIDSVLIYGIKHLRYKEVKSHYIFYIDANLIVKNTNNLKVSTLCKLINYGDLKVRGYPIFSNTFKFVAANVTRYYAQYIEQLLGGI